MDCEDESDEHQCSFIKLSEDKYRNSYSPENLSLKGQSYIFVGFDVIDIVKIDEPGVGISEYLKMCCQLCLV